MFASKFAKRKAIGNRKDDRFAKKSSSLRSAPSGTKQTKAQKSSTAQNHQLVRVHFAQNCPRSGSVCRIDEHWHLAARCTGTGVLLPNIWHFSSGTSSVVSYQGRCKNHPNCTNDCVAVRETIRRSQYRLCRDADCEECRGVREVLDKQAKSSSSGIWA